MSSEYNIQEIIDENEYINGENKYLERQQKILLDSFANIQNYTNIKIDENKAKLEKAIQRSKKTMQHIDHQLNLKMNEKVKEIRNIKTEIEERLKTISAIERDLHFCKKTIENEETSKDKKIQEFQHIMHIKSIEKINLNKLVIKQQTEIASLSDKHDGIVSLLETKKLEYSSLLNILKIF